MTPRTSLAALVTLVLGVAGGMLTTAAADAGPALPKPPPNSLPPNYTPPACIGAVHRYQPTGDLQRCGGEIVIPCFPYACDASGKTCGSACMRDSDCATGARCAVATRQCAPERPPAPPPLCPTLCAGPDSAAVKERAYNPATQRCEVVAVSPCGPFRCDSATNMCRFECSLDRECAPGAQCNPVDKVCGYANPICKDVKTILLGSGQELPCSPYTCSSGMCRTQCDGDDDCALPHVCTQGKCTLAQK